MSFQADNPTSPLFWLLISGVLVDAVYVYAGLVQGRLPNMRTSVRGARVAGVLALISLGLVLVSYIFFTTRGELFGTAALVLAAGTFMLGFTLAERIPD